jgi:hypothetical protein
VSSSPFQIPVQQQSASTLSTTGFTLSTVILLGQVLFSLAQLQQTPGGDHEHLHQNMIMLQAEGLL